MDAIKILVVGAGGTGGNIVTNLCRLLEPIKDKTISIIVADGDIIEKKNRERQPYSFEEEGLNKADTLVYKCSQVFDVKISSYPHYIEDVNALQMLLPGTLSYHNSAYIPILVGAVDNNKTRAVFHNFFNQSRNLFYIDSGNETWDGQVICGVRADFKTIASPAAEIYPDILKSKEVFKSQKGCADIVVEKPQQFITNLQAAIITLSYISDIVITGDLKTHQSTFDIKTKAMRSYDAPWAKNLKKVAV